MAVFEKATQVGGTTATSGGAIWIPANSLARAAGVADSLDAAREYLHAQLGPFERRDLVEAYLASGAAVVDYLHERSEIKFDLMPAPDYVSSDPGAVETGRCLVPKPFDGALLGDAFGMVRPPRAAFMVLGGLMVGRKEIPMLLRPFASWDALCHVTKLLLRHARDRLRHPRGTRLLIGNALIARALYSARRLGVRVETSAALAQLVMEDGRVTGAIVSTSRGSKVVRARRAAYSSEVDRRFRRC